MFLGSPGRDSSPRRASSARSPTLAQPRSGHPRRIKCCGEVWTSNAPDLGVQTSRREVGRMKRGLVATIMCVVFVLLVLGGGAPQLSAQSTEKWKVAFPQV